MVSIIQAMERNWARYGSIDRLTDGVAMMPSQRQAAEVNQDDDTMVYGRQAARAAQHGADEQRAPTAARTISYTASATIASTVAQEAAFDFTTTDPPLPTAVRGSNVPGFGLLTLLMQPGNALVLLDYLDSGKLDRREVWTGKPLRLPAGRVSVHASAPGYEDLRTCIDLSATDMQIALSLSAATSNLSTSNASTSNAFTSASLAAMSTAIGMTQPYANAQPLLSSAPTHAAFSIAALPGGKWTESPCGQSRRSARRDWMRIPCARPIHKRADHW